MLGSPSLGAHDLEQSPVNRRLHLGREPVYQTAPRSARQDIATSDQLAEVSARRRVRQV